MVNQTQLTFTQQVLCKYDITFIGNGPELNQFWRHRFNSLTPNQNGQDFSDDILKGILIYIAVLVQ